jgi:translocation and assembly module TamB
MNRARKITLIVLCSLAGLALTLFIAVIIVVQTSWFRETVRDKIAGAIDEATGGRAEIGEFAFDWTHLRATVRNFVIHGLEPPGAAPLFRANLVQVEAGLFTHGLYEIRSLLVDTPQANVMVLPDGRTNIPSPKVQKTSNKNPLQTVVDLAVGRFDLRNGSAAVSNRKVSFNARGENLRARLAYNTARPGYSGEIDMSPLYIESGRNRAVNADVKLPVAIDSNGISLDGARITTPGSQIAITASMTNMDSPVISGRVTAHISVEEVNRAAGLLPAGRTPARAPGEPRYLDADVAASLGNSRIEVRSAKVTLGQSRLEASGAPNNVRFDGTLALGQIGRMFGVAARPEGSVRIGGDAALNPSGGYHVTANVAGRDLAFGEKGTRVSGVSLDAAVAAQPNRIDLGGIRLAAFGGEFDGSASIQNMAQFRVKGDLRHFDIDRFARAFAHRSLNVNGQISGPVQAAGDLKNPSAAVARANLRIAPAGQAARRGESAPEPLRGHIDVSYNGRSGAVTFAPSEIVLPHTRIDLAGSLGQEIRVRMVSRDLNDFRQFAVLPVNLTGGSAVLNATLAGSLSEPHIAGDLTMTRFSVEGRPFDRLSAAVNLSKSGAAITNAVITRGAMQADISGTVGLRDWKPEPREALRADATVRNADVSDILTLAGKPDLPVTGGLTADLHVSGTVGSPTGHADLSVASGTIQGEHFDSLVAHVVMGQNTIDVPTLQFIAGPSRIDASATYQHATNDLQRGTLRARIASNQVQFAQFQSLAKQRPGLGGTVSLNADLAAEVEPPGPGAGFQLTAFNGNLSARGLRMEGRNLGDFTAAANTAGSTITYSVNSNFAGSSIRVNGHTLLTGRHETAANALIANLPIDRVLSVAGRGDIPVRGTFSASAQVAGTLEDPRASANFDIARGSAYQEPFDSLQAGVAYSNQLIDVSSFQLTKGGSAVQFAGSLAHPAGDFQRGQLRFRLHSNEVQLSQFQTLQKAMRGAGGIVRLSADGAATLRPNAAPLFSSLNANLEARELSLEKRTLGGLTARAETRGREVTFQLASDLARANIRGDGNMELGGDYPFNARLQFSNVTYAGVKEVLGGAVLPVEASLEGQASVSGPAVRTEALRGRLEVTKFESRSIPAGPGQQPRGNFELHNSGTIVAALDRGVVTVQSANITGPLARLSVSGSVPVSGPGSMNLRADGNIQLKLLEAFSQNIFSDGAVVLKASATGTAAKPAVNGRVQLQNASFNMVGLPMGIDKGNGAVVFTGTGATIQNLTAESGGGKIALNGFVAYGGPQMNFRAQVTADRIHVDYPQSVTTEASAKLVLAGTTERSLLSGTVTIDDVALHPQSDIGSMLTSAAAPASAKGPTTGVLAGMRFDVRIQTTPATQFRTTMTENLQADAGLTLRGSPDEPGMLGRVNVTQGVVVFFGTQYTINRGVVTFTNPHKIDPNLNVSLQTTVQGVDVSIGVTGPMDRLKLSYRSDPPLEFNQIVSLLASGKLPTTDPVLAAHQPAAPQQSFQQVGASTLLGQAVANPVSGRLQRLFGVSKLSINPEITGPSNTAQATLTLQQQITPELSFTYIQDVTRANSEVIRVQWAINPQWTAVAQRDIYGEFDLDFYWKKRFR